MVVPHPNQIPEEQDLCAVFVFTVFDIIKQKLLHAYISPYIGIYTHN
jgi:hypothetical protein